MTTWITPVAFDHINLSLLQLKQSKLVGSYYALCFLDTLVDISKKKRTTGKAIFSNEQEKLLANHLITNCNIFHGLSLAKFRELTYEYAKSVKLTMSVRWEQNKCAGEDWSVIQEKTVSYPSGHRNLLVWQGQRDSRGSVPMSFTESIKGCWKRAQFFTDRIHNSDETGITTIQPHGKVLAPKGRKQVGALASVERGSLVTMCNVISATRHALPPVVVVPRVDLKKTHD